MHNLLNCDADFSGCLQDKLLHKYLSSHDIAKQPQTLRSYTESTSQSNYSWRQGGNVVSFFEQKTQGWLEYTPYLNDLLICTQYFSPLT